MKREQKYINYRKDYHGSFLGESGSDSYLASQCRGNSGLEKDLSDGWIIRWVFENEEYIIFILERP